VLARPRIDRIADDRRHPLLACGELEVVRVAGARVVTSPDGARRGSVDLEVVEPLLGERRAGDRLELEVATAGLDIHAGNWSPWDFVDLTPGRRLLFAPGGMPSVELRRAGVREVPRILEPLPEPCVHGLAEQDLDLDEVRAIAAIRKRPAAERHVALRIWLAEARFTQPAWGSAAACELAAADPDECAGVDTLLFVVLRDDLSDQVRRGWAVALEEHEPSTDEGRRRRRDALWFILDRPSPPPTEDPRLALDAALCALEGVDLRGDPRDHVPAGCSRRRLLEAVEALSGRDLAEYGEDRFAMALPWLARLPA
jgi:hypothetical protein